MSFSAKADANAFVDKLKLAPTYGADSCISEFADELEKPVHEGKLCWIDVLINWQSRRRSTILAKWCDLGGRFTTIGKSRFFFLIEFSSTRGACWRLPTTQGTAARSASWGIARLRTTLLPCKRSDVALIKAGAQVDGKSAFYASRRQLRAWPGEGGGGAAYETGSLLFSVFGSRPLLRPVDN